MQPEPRHHKVFHAHLFQDRDADHFEQILHIIYDHMFVNGMLM